MTTVYTDINCCKVYSKGAAECVLASCTRYLASDTRSAPLDDASRAYYRALISDYAAESLRVIALAYREVAPSSVPQSSWDAQISRLEGELVLVGLLGLEDPLRPEAA